MIRAEPSGSHRAHRHLLTSAAGGPLGGPGFQTIAAAGTLGAELVEQLEGYVGFFALPAGDSGHPVLQLRRWDDNFQLLTRYLATGDGGDGRTGNYLAESLLVPTAWLAESGWDVAAAFAAVDWWGAERSAELAGEERSLAEEELPALAAGDLARLTGLAERAPGELLAHLLLALVGWASRGERLVVVEAHPERPADLEAVISLLPLALPPSCRFARRGGRWRGIELRTRGPARGMAEVDLAGVAAGDLDAAETEGGTVLDLGGRLPLDDRPDLEGYDYAQWAVSAIREGRWREIEEIYARAAEVPPDELFRRFAELRRGWQDGGGEGGATRPATAVAGGTPTPPRRRKETPRPVAPSPAAPDHELPGDALPGVAAERRERWQGRRNLEAAAARGHDAWRGEVAALVGALEEENRRALEDLRGELDEVGERLLERLRSEREALLEETRRAFEAEAIEAQKRLHRDLERGLAQVREEGDELLRQMRRDAGRRERRLATSEGAGPGSRAGGAAR
ncbi:MAG TPA: hypothetical protein VM617_08580, partial [Thermoanaerobaculia bacterium]|nr:hypothetical protein [Thermoanaerobaculia bacterium]